MAMLEIETDYLVVGAGAAGMAFVDELIAHSDRDVVMVDRRHRPGGHWNDAYPFVRLHQPSAFYGVTSRVLGTESIDTAGPNAGFYDRATGVQIRDYYQRVLEDHLLPSGKVRFFGKSDYVGDWSNEHAFTSIMTGNTSEVRVREKVVNATYMETSVPATHTPGLRVDAEARLVPVGDLVNLADAPAGYTVLGSGKTAMDACNWLLDNGVDPDRIRWIRPRDPWLFERAALQPLDLLSSTIEHISAGVEGLAQAEDLPDVFRRLEACGLLARLDPTVEPTMFRGAITSKAERDALGQIEQVARHGRVVHIGADKIVLDDATIETTRDEVHVDCTAYGLNPAPVRPVFEPGQITIQLLTNFQACLSAAQTGFIEATRDDDEEKNRLCLATAIPSRADDLVRILDGLLRSFVTRTADPDLAAWSETARLSITRGTAERIDDPVMQEAMTRWAMHTEPAVSNAQRLLAA